MGYLGEEIPKFGFGLMRLPMVGDDVDIDQTKVMVDKFLDAGFTYFDTAYGYINGKSEEAIKVALVDRYSREKFQLATKLPAWAGPKTAEEAKQMLHTSLERTGAGYFDYYLLHNLGGERTNAFDEFGIWDYALEMKEKGLIKHLGFSLHDTADVLDEILTKHPEMEFVQLQINYADWESESVQSRKCFEVAKKHNKPVIIMEPVKGGLLAQPPESVTQLFDKANPNVSYSSWAMRYAASLDNIITVLSGVSNIAQMEDNIQTMANFAPLNSEEMQVIDKARDILGAIPSIPCTSCRYCVKGCPVNVAIPEVFGKMNDYLIYGGDIEKAKEGYKGWIVGGLDGAASKCIACGQCEAVCPQHIEIISELEKAANTLE